MSHADLATGWTHSISYVCTQRRNLRAIPDSPGHCHSMLPLVVIDHHSMLPLVVIDWHSLGTRSRILLSFLSFSAGMTVSPCLIPDGFWAHALGPRNLPWESMGAVNIGSGP